ncbi:MAG: hypothetical protein M1830_001296 [Pleopsidium flavum]|nr:MAG: hypothetical protein M1830_001296 [Pleopsidium flavum]
MTETTQLPGFLRIPREVRNQIYSYLLKPRRSQTGFQLIFPRSILLTNHQIHDEASEVLYGSNEFQLEIDWTSPDIQASLACLEASRYLNLINLDGIRLYDQNAYPPTAEKRVRQCLQTVCELLATGPRLRHFSLYVTDRIQHDDWEVEKRVLEPLRLLRNHVDKVKLDDQFLVSRVSDADGD